jgi:methionyl-tRNA formyltransferase
VTALRTIFAGTPDFAVPALQALIESEHHRPLAVLTQPDRGAGRGRKVGLRAGQAMLALDAGIEVLQPTQPQDRRHPGLELAALKPDLLITAAYGLLLPQAVLDLPVHGCWNLHASLLPRWRGASPINQAVLAGDAETGISLMQMEAGLDTGPVLLQASHPDRPGRKCRGNCMTDLSAMAAAVLIDGLDRLVSGNCPRLPGPESDPWPRMRR